jgi:hypothetical protein
VELVEIRPMGMRREATLARVRIPLSQLSQFIDPEPYPEHTGGKIVASATAGHTAWFVMEEVPAELITSKGLTNMMRDVTMGTLSTTSKVTMSTMSMMMAPLRGGGGDDSDSIGSTSTGKHIDSSTGKASVGGAMQQQGQQQGQGPPSSAVKLKDNYLSMLSSDHPRPDISAPQLKIRIRIVEERV